MRFLAFAIVILFSSTGRGQDTLKINCTQEQAVKALLEKGFALESKHPNKIVTKAFETRYLGSSAKNEIVLRFTIVTNGTESLMTGEYSTRFKYYHQGNKAWAPILNDKIHQRTWGMMTDFSKYVSEQVTQK